MIGVGLCCAGGREKRVGSSPSSPTTVGPASFWGPLKSQGLSGHQCRDHRQAAGGRRWTRPPGQLGFPGTEWYPGLGGCQRKGWSSLCHQGVASPSCHSDGPDLTSADGGPAQDPREPWGRTRAPAPECCPSLSAPLAHGPILREKVAQRL